MSEECGSLFIGGSAAGPFSALLLARAGHEVTVVDPDAFEPAPDAESAASAAFRPAAPQTVQAHATLPRFRELVMDRLPDVYGGLPRGDRESAAGVHAAVAPGSHPGGQVTSD